MNREIERKFLIINDSWRKGAEGIRYRQGYLSIDSERVVRIRTAAGKGHLTIKGRYVGAGRPEFEYEIPVQDAHMLLETLCLKPLIEKIRYKIKYRGFVWDIDEFEGANAGLIIAEVELKDEKDKFDIPDWIGQEVSDDPKYFNSNLIKHPFHQWK